MQQQFSSWQLHTREEYTTNIFFLLTYYGIMNKFKNLVRAASPFSTKTPSVEKKRNRANSLTESTGGSQDSWGGYKSYTWNLDNIDLCLALIYFYREKNEDKVSLVPKILKQFQGDEILLLQQLCERHEVSEYEMNQFLLKAKRVTCDTDSRSLDALEEELIRDEESVKAKHQNYKFSNDHSKGDEISEMNSNPIKIEKKKLTNYLGRNKGLPQSRNDCEKVASVESDAKTEEVVATDPIEVHSASLSESKTIPIQSNVKKMGLGQLFNNQETPQYTKSAYSEALKPHPAPPVATTNTKKTGGEMSTTSNKVASELKTNADFNAIVRAKDQEIIGLKFDLHKSKEELNEAKNCNKELVHLFIKYLSTDIPKSIHGVVITYLSENYGKLRKCFDFETQRRYNR